MSKREPRLLIGDIIDSAEKIKRYTESLSFDEFLQDSKTRDAVVRNFEIIGEAAKRLPEEFKQYLCLNKLVKNRWFPQSNCT